MEENSKLIPLTQGQFAIVDAEDYDWLTRDRAAFLMHGDAAVYNFNDGGWKEPCHHSL